MEFNLGNNEGFLLKRNDPSLDIDLTKLTTSKKVELVYITSQNKTVHPGVYTILRSSLTNVVIELDPQTEGIEAEYVIEFDRDELPNVQSITWPSGVVWENTPPDVSDFTQLNYSHWIVTIHNGFLGSHKRIYAHKPINHSQRYFTTEAIENGTFTFTMVKNITVSSVPYMSYSIDNGETWVRTDNVNGEAVFVTTPTINAGDVVLWKSEGVEFNSSNNRAYFSSTAPFNVSGNIMSLEYADDFIGKTTLKGTFNRLLESTRVVSAANLILPSDTLIRGCYAYMFSSSSLTTPPKLPATTLDEYCYSGMFNNCTSLTTAPELPATTLANSCYTQMFYSCTSLTTAPELPALTLVNYCYSYMFWGCTSLNYIKAMFTTTPSTTYTNNWVRNVAATGTFVKNSAAQWNVTGIYAVPSGWTVETANA